MRKPVIASLDLILLTNTSFSCLRQVRELFKVLVEKALSQERRSDGSWREKLDEKYHCFAGNYHRLPVPNFHRFEIVKELGDDGLMYDLRFQPELLMAPPVSNDEAQPCFFNAEEYAKHLIGNVSVFVEVHGIYFVSIAVFIRKSHRTHYH